MKRHFSIGKILIFLCFSCCSFKQPKYCKLSDRIYFPYNREICAQKNLHLEGKGGAMMGDIQQICAHYGSYEYLTIEQARRLYVEVIEGYLSRYNQNEQIRPYLHNYPFTIENIDIMIGFRNVQRLHVDPGFVALMFIGRNNQLIYRAYNSEAKTFIPMHEEPYEVARDIVLSNCSSSLAQ